MNEERPAPERTPEPPPAPETRPAPDGGEEGRKGGGWQKPVRPPTQESLPGGLPPKKDA